MELMHLEVRHKRAAATLISITHRRLKGEQTVAFMQPPLSWCALACPKAEKQGEQWHPPPPPPAQRLK